METEANRSAVKEPGKTVWRDTYRLHSYEVDQFGEARPHVLVNFLLDSAWAHVRDSSFSYETLVGQGQFWVLSRLYASLHRTPQWNDEVVIETWGKGTDRLFALRDFEAFSPSGDKLVSASSCWLIVDRKTLRPQRLDRLGERFPIPAGRQAVSTPLEKIAERPVEGHGIRYSAVFSDIDVNHHVNSSRYVQWIMDSFPREILTGRRMSSFEINFLAEAQIQDAVAVFTQADGDRYFSEIRRDSDGVALCRALVAWSDRRDPASTQ